MEQTESLNEWTGYMDCDIQNLAPDSDTISIQDDKSGNVYTVYREEDGTVKVIVEFYTQMREAVTVDLTLGSDGGTVIVRDL